MTQPASVAVLEADGGFAWTSRGAGRTLCAR